MDNIKLDSGLFGGNGGGNSFQEDDNTLKAVTWVKSLEAIGYGIQGGPLNDLQSFYLDDTPMYGTDNKPTYSNNVLIDKRIAEDTNTINGFEEVGAVVAVSTDVLFATPVIRTVSSSLIDRVGLTIRLPSGLYNQNTSDNKLEKTTLSFKVEVKLSASPTWSTVALTKTYNDKTTGPFEETFSINRPSGAGTWDIRVTKLTPDSTTSTLKNTLQWAYFNEFQSDNIVYHNTYLVGYQLNANGINATRIPTRSVIWKGRHVRLPNVYDGDNHSYSGVWDLSTFKTGANKQWTDDPAWVIFDLATDSDVGLGLSDSQVDLTSFYEASLYNNASVEYKGTVDDEHPAGVWLRPRYAFNAPIDTASSAIDWMKKVAATMNATLLWVNGQLTLVQDRPTTFSYVFTNANVVNGNFIRSETPYDTRYTACNVTWNSPDDGYKQSVVSYSASLADIEKYGFQETNIAAFGCTSKSQAINYAKWVVDSSINTYKSISFITGEIGATLLPGDVVRVYDNVYAGADAAGRLLDNNTTTVLNLDRAVSSITTAPVTFLPTISATFTKKDHATTGLRNLVSATAHGFSDGMPVKFSTITTTTGITVGTTYYVKNATTDTFQLSATAGGAVLELTNNGTGVINASRVVKSGHGLSSNSMAGFATIVSTTGISINTRYYVVNATRDHFQLSLTPGGAAITLTTAGSGTLQPSVTIWGTDGTLLADVPITTTGTASTITLTSALASIPSEGAIFQITTNSISPETYRIIEREELDDGQFQILAGQYDENKYSRIETGTTLTPPIYSGIKSPVTQPPTGLTFAERSTNLDLSIQRTVIVTWTPVPNQVISGYRVTYTIDGGNKIVQEVKLPTIEIEANAGTLNLQVQSLGYTGLPSLPVAGTYTIAATETTGSSLNAVTNLVVYGTAGTSFTTPDLIIQWTNPTTNGSTAVSVARFKVEVYNGATLLRSEYVEGVAAGQIQTYTYSYDNNRADGGPRRSITVKVYAQEVSRKLSSVTTATFTNAAPSVPSGLAVTGGVGQVFVTCTAPTDNDYKGTIVWASLTNGFTPASGNVVYDGSDNLITFKSLGSGVHYVKVAHYDSFGKDYAGTGLNLSVQQTATPVSNAGIPNGSTNPVTGTEGDLFFNTTDGKLYRYHSSAWTVAVPTVDLTGTITNAQIADAALTTAKFASGIEPVSIVTTNPVTKTTNSIFNTTDSKLYRWNGTTYVATVPTTDLTGTIGTSQIADAALTTAKFASTIEPVSIVTTNPGTKTTNAIFNTTDDKLYRWNGTTYVATVPTTDLTGTITTAQITDAALTTAKFASSIEPVTIVSSVPGTKSTNAIFNTTDDKLYRWNGTTYVATVPTTDLTGTITTAQITDAALTTAKFAAGIEPVAIVATNPGTKSTSTIFNTTDSKLYRWNGTTYVATVPTTDLTGTITTAQIADAALTTAKFASGIEPVSIVTTNPGTKTTNSIFNTTDSKMYRWNGTTYVATVPTTDLTGTITTAQITDAALTTAKFAAGIEPVSVVSAVPGTKSTNTIFNTTDDKIYRWNGTAYVATIPTTDLTGTITTTQIADSGITTPKIATNAITTNKLLVVGRGQELNADPNLQDSTAWSTGGSFITSITDSPTGGANAWQSIAGVRTDNYSAEYIPVDQDANYRAEVMMRQSVGTLANAYIGIFWYDSAKVALVANVAQPTGAGLPAGWVSNGSGSYYLAGSVVPTTWTSYTVGFGPGETAKIPSNARYMRIAVLGNFNNTASAVIQISRQALLRKSDGNLIVDGSITAAKMAADSITAGSIAAGAIGTTELAANAVTAAKIAVGTITANEIAGATITGAKIAANTIAAGNIVAGTITSAEIAADTITTGNIAAGAISTTELAANAVTAAKIATGTITANEIAASTITGAKIAAGTIAAGNIVSGTITSTQIAADTITAGNIAAGAISTTELAANAVTAAKIATGTITANEIAGATITGAKIAADTITASNIAAATITSAEIAADTITAGNIAAGAISTTELAANAVTAAKIATGTITANEIAASTITGAKIAGTTITGSNLVAGTITSTQIAADTITAGNIAAGAIGASEIAAGAITTDKLFVTGRGKALNDDPACSDNSAWTVAAGNAVVQADTTAPSGTTSIRSTNATLLRSRQFPVEAGKTYKVSVYAKKGTVGGGMYLRLYAYAPTGGTEVSYLVTGLTPTTGFFENITVPTSWTRYTGYATPAATASYAIASIHTNWNTTGTTDICDFRVEEYIGADLVVDGAISTAKLAAGAVTATKIAAGTITSTEIAADTITAGNIAAGAISTTELAANAVTAAKIATGTITANEIAASTITGAKIAADTISSGNIAANAITSSELAANSVVAGKIAASTITSSEIAANTITAANIAANTITASQLAAGTITANEIASATITGAKIAAGTISASNIVTGTITTDRLQVGSVNATASTGGSTKSLALSADTSNLTLSIWYPGVQMNKTYNGSSLSGTSGLKFNFTTAAGLTAGYYMVKCQATGMNWDQDATSFAAGGVTSGGAFPALGADATTTYTHTAIMYLRPSVSYDVAGNLFAIAANSTFTGLLYLRVLSPGIFITLPTTGAAATGALASGYMSGGASMQEYKV